jgi:hypothetical protein
MTSFCHRVFRRGTGLILGGLVVALAAPPAAGQFSDETRSVTKRGTTAAEFLSIPVGARATAMGGAFSATVDDATSIYWNPSGLAAMTKGAFSVEYATWLADIDFNYVAVVLPTGAGTFGFGVTSMRSPEMEVTTVERQEGTGERFTTASYAFSLSYGRDLTDRFAIGGTVKAVTERIWHSSASGVAFDIGTMFVTPLRGIRLGASISNFGTKLRMQGDDLLTLVDIDPNNRGTNDNNRALMRTDAFDLPLTMRIGLAGEVYRSAQSRLTLAVDALSPNNSEQYVNVGSEVGLLGDLIMLRAGYSELLLEDSIRSLTLGGGLHYRFGPLDVAIDYAFESHQYFSGVNRLNLAVQF